MKSWFLGLVTDPIFKVTVEHKLPFSDHIYHIHTNGIFHKATYNKKKSGWSVLYFEGSQAII